MEQKASRKIYPVNPVDYILVEEVGQGVSAIVYRATCIPFNETVAVKVLDFERCNSSLDEIRREAQTMRLTNHPNILSAHCSFVVEQTLWVVMPYMAGGSFFHIMKSAYPDGFEEPVIATILRECLKGLEYLHNNGFIHRDVKAGNILVDRSGAVKLGDFGVSACMFDTGDRQRSWNTFAGTPCWMAPEVMEQFHGYDFKADIWSFGITALELAHGHAPFSKYPPMKVLLMTLQNAPPGLDYERDKRFSKAFRKLIAVCLVKEPSKRPSAEKLLKHSFFKRAHFHEFIARTILDSLPPLGHRLRDMKLKDADMLGQNKMPFDEKEERSQNEYKRGISAWNFDVEDLKAQAALIQDDDESIVKEDATCTSRKSENLVGCPNADILQSPATIDSLRQESLINADGHITGDQSRPLLASSLQNSKEVLENMHKEDRGDNRVNEVRENVKKETNTHDPLLQKLEERDLKVKRLPRDFRRSSSGPLVAEHVLSSYHGQDEDKDPERKSFQCNGDVFQSFVRGRREHTFSGPLTLKGTIEGLERGLCVRRGRFSVTPENVDLLEVEASDREQQLLQKLAKLQQRINSLEAELEATKLQNRHLEQQLNIQ